MKFATSGREKRAQLAIFWKAFSSKEAIYFHSMTLFFANNNENACFQDFYLIKLFFEILYNKTALFCGKKVYLAKHRGFVKIWSINKFKIFGQIFGQKKTFG